MPAGRRARVISAQCHAPWSGVGFGAKPALGQSPAMGLEQVSWPRRLHSPWQLHQESQLCDPLLEALTPLRSPPL